jgi:hypothetical protein
MLFCFKVYVSPVIKSLLAFTIIVKVHLEFLIHLVG